MTIHEMHPTVSCEVQASGAIELYFYDELSPGDRLEVDAHVSGCARCREALEEMLVIRDALASRPVVSTPASGEWSGFMGRLDAAVAREEASRQSASGGLRRPYVGYLAMAALLAIVTMSVLSIVRYRSAASGANPVSTAAANAPADVAPAGNEAADLAKISDEHFRRSKLVVLGLATKDAQHVSQEDWTYERSLASDLLSDTRIYRMAAEDRGMRQVAGVMRDLELVLLETSLTSDANPSALAQIQHLIQKRDLVQKMNVVGTSGL